MKHSVFPRVPTDSTAVSPCLVLPEARLAGCRVRELGQYPLLESGGSPLLRLTLQNFSGSVKPYHYALRWSRKRLAPSGRDILGDPNKNCSGHRSPLNSHNLLPDRSYKFCPLSLFDRRDREHLQFVEVCFSYRRSDCPHLN